MMASQNHKLRLKQGPLGKDAKGAKDDLGNCSM